MHILQDNSHPSIKNSAVNDFKSLKRIAKSLKKVVDIHIHSIHLETFPFECVNFATQAYTHILYLCFLITYGLL